VKVLLLHPLPLDGSIFTNDLHALGGGCHAPTLYEAGNDIVDWARAALDVVGDGPIVVIGNSIGGSCAIEVARLAPAKVKALVLCGAKPGHRPEPTFRDEALQLIADEGLRAAWDRYWLPLFGPNTPADVLNRMWLVASRQGERAISSGVRAFHGRPDRSAFLARWDGPVLIVSGEHDIHPARARSLAKRLPNAEFRLIAGVGHYVPVEAPRELVMVAREAVANVR
jgi:pimeloyl-ACP methyl ester carboxylesterase